MNWQKQYFPGHNGNVKADRKNWGETAYNDHPDRFRRLGKPFLRKVKMLQSVKEVGIEEGLEQGRFEASEKIAKNLLRSGKLTIKEIAVITDLKLARIRELAKTVSSGT